MTKRRKERRPLPFYVRYVELEPERVFNTLNPMNQMCAKLFWDEWGDTWWEPETIEKRKFFANCYKQKHDDITGHYTKLRESINQEGLKHPILAVTGTWRDARLKEIFDVPVWFPPEMIANPSEAIYVHTHGGSRMIVAEEMGMEKIPCAVIDFEHKFNDAPEINSGNLERYYGKNYTWTSMNVKIVNKVQYHLKNSQYGSMNNKTRRAQQEAAEYAYNTTRATYFPDAPVDPNPE